MDEVLSRKLLELENRLPKFDTPMSAVEQVTLDGTNDLTLLADKVNEIVKSYNTLLSELNKTAKNRI